MVLLKVNDKDFKTIELNCVHIFAMHLRRKNEYRTSIGMNATLTFSDLLKVLAMHQVETL